MLGESALLVYLLGLPLMIELGWGQTGVASATITGTVSYRQRVALPPDAAVDVRLEDVSLQDAPATVIAETVFSTGGKQVPIPFQLQYNPSDILPSHSYNLRANISVKGQVLFRSTASNPVITHGAPTDVAIMLDQAESPPPASPGSENKSRSKATLEDTHWKLGEINGKAVSAGAGDKEAYILLQPNEKRLSGSAGCNRLIGTYQVKGDAIHFNPAGMTMMMCPDPVMKQERALVDALQATTSYRIEGSQLELLDGDRVAARFQAEDKK